MAFDNTKLSYFHSFSKMPAQNSTTLGNAINKSGHTVTASEVWAQDIPYYGKMGSIEDVKSKVQPYARKNDMCYITAGADKGKTFQYDGNGNWTDITATLVDGALIKNANDDVVLLYHKGQTLTNLTADNNANTDSANNAARLWAKRDTEGVTIPNSGTRLIEQFVAPTDKALNGLASVAYAPVIANGSLVSGTNYYDYCFSGTILWATARTASTLIDCFEYVGQKVSTVVDTVSAQGTTLQNVKDQVDTISDALGLGATPNQTTLGSRVTANETALKVLLGLAEGDAILASESIATTAANAVSESLTGDAEGTIGKAIADAKQEALDAINAIQHFSVVVVPTGQTMENVTPVENTIYLVSDSQAADGSYIEYIAFKQGESVVTEKIGSTKLDLSGYTTDAEHEALQGRVSTTEGQIATITSTDATKEGSIAKALADAKTYAEGQASAAKSGAETTAANALSAARTEITAEIAQAKSEAIASAEVTINQGTGIVVTGAGKGTTFTIAVSDEVATAASVSALSQVVASNKTELEGKITAAETAASTALETAKSEIKGTTDALDARLQTAEGKVSTLEGQVATLTTGDNSVAKQIETAANAIKGQSLAQTGTLSGMFSVTTAGSVGTGITGITIEDKGLATAIAAAKSGAEQTAATNLATARGEITTEIGTAVSGLETKLTTGEGSLGAKVTALEGSVKTINETTIPNAITTAQNGAVATVKALTLSASDTDDAAKVTVTLGGTVETPTITVTSSDIASAQTLATLKSTVETHISEAAGLYLSVEKVDTLPADADAKANKIYLVPVDTEAGRAQNIHTEYIWTNGQWEIIGTTAIDINSLEASAKAAQDAADKAQGEVDAVEEAIAAMDADLSVNGISVKQVDGTITELSEALITGSVPEGTTKVEGNIAYVGSTKHVIAPDKFETATRMPSSIQSWVADLSNLTNGDYMFCDCHSLGTFIGDLSSLTSADFMFSRCTLNAESLEILAENLPTVSGGRIDIGYSANVTDEIIATIEGKGWNVVVDYLDPNGGQ